MEEPTTVGYAGREKENLCGLGAPPGDAKGASGQSIVDQRYKALTTDTLWKARWAFALCDAELMREVANTQVTPESDELLRVYVGYANWNLGNDERFRSLLAPTHLKERFEVIAVSAADEGDWERAWEYGDQAVSLGASGKRLLIAYATAGMRTHQSQSKIVWALDQASQLDPGDYVPYQLTMQYYFDYSQPQNLDAAQHAMELACAHGMKVESCHYWRGNIAYSRKDYKQALDESALATRTNDQSLRTSALYLQALASMRLGNASNAVPLLQELVQARPQDKSFARDYALALMVTGKLKEAAAECGRIATFCPTCLKDPVYLDDLASLPECKR